MSVRAIVVMGPSGSGKTTIGERLAARLEWPFIEGDSFHSAENVKKMAGGTPLTDADRAPWLARLAEELMIYDAQGECVVMACSALKESYRATLRVHDGVKFVFLKTSPDLLRSRVASRKGHFVPPELVASQIRDLEEPSDALVEDAARTPAEIVDDVVAALF